MDNPVTQALSMLETSLSLTEGAVFFFIVTPAFVEKASQKEELLKVIGDRHVVEVRVSPEMPLDFEKVRERVTSLLKQEVHPVVLVETENLDVADVEVSIDGLLADSIHRARRVLQDLNMKREALARLGVPILFLVTPATLRAFSTWAADLFSANSGVFHLEAPLTGTFETTGIERQFEKLWAEEHALWRLPEEEIRNRIRLYEGQLEQEARKRTPHRPLLASLCSELSKLHRRLGNLLQALEHQERATAFYEELSRENPKVFLPNLAGSLNSLGIRLSELGKRSEALNAAREAVEIYRRLAQENPDAFLPDLARSLGVYGFVLRMLGRHSDACEAFAEAIRHLHPFHHRLPEAFDGLMRALVRGYLSTCQEVGLEPDQGILKEIESCFASSAE